jgi:hypothetical protein
VATLIGNMAYLQPKLWALKKKHACTKIENIIAKNGYNHV